MSSRKKPEDLGEGDTNYDTRRTGGPVDSQPLIQSGNREHFIPSRSNEAGRSLAPPVQYDTDLSAQPKQEASSQYAQPWVPQVHYTYHAEDQPGYESAEAATGPREDPSYQPDPYQAYAQQPPPDPEYMPTNYAQFAPRPPAMTYGTYQQMPRGPMPREEQPSEAAQHMAQPTPHAEAYEQFPSLEGNIILEDNAQGQTAPTDGLPKITTNAWESENTLYIAVEVAGHSLTRRLDNNLINGTKLLNYTGITRGRRDGILKQEKVRHVIRIGNQNLKGVWIPWERAYELAKECGKVDALYPLFLANMEEFLYSSHNVTRTQQVVRSAQQQNPGFQTWMWGIPRKFQHPRAPQRPPSDNSEDEEEVYQAMQYRHLGQQQYPPIPGHYGHSSSFGSFSYDGRGLPAVKPHSSSMQSRRQSGQAVPRSHRRQYSIDKPRASHQAATDRYTRPSSYLPSSSMPSSSSMVGSSDPQGMDTGNSSGTATGLGILTEFGSQDYASSQQYYPQHEYPQHQHGSQGPYQHMQDRLQQGGQPLIPRPSSQHQHQHQQHQHHQQQQHHQHHQQQQPHHQHEPK